MKPLLVIADDEPLIRTALLRILTPFGFEIMLANSGEQALEYVRAVKPDLVMLDVEMPGMGGIKCLREIRALHKDILVIMLTGVIDDQVGQMAIRYGASDYLTKPIGEEALKKCLNVHLLLSENGEKFSAR